MAWWALPNPRAGNRAHRRDRQCALPRLGADPAGATAIDKRIADGVPPEARDQLLGKTASGEFVTPEQLGELALFLCSEGAVNVRGAAWNMDGGWVGSSFCRVGDAATRQNA
jgi:NAD(P)-dependent dehydrogenase (short-subunit alcohol dehydrogenase family)